MKPLKYFLALLVMSPVFCLAQTFSKEDTAKSKEIQISIIELVAKAANNFENLRGEKLTADKAFINIKYYCPTNLQNSRVYRLYNLPVLHL